MTDAIRGASRRLRLDALAKRFGGRSVLEEISLDIEPGEILALLGPSGSGKTTLLRLLAGFETPDFGSIRIGDEEVTRLAPERRGFGMVFQSYALFPHLSVGENVAFGLKSRGLGRPEIARRVAAALARVDLADFESRRVGELSGGQQQRAAVARALAPEPRVLLLDEPLSNLDPTLRERTRRELATLLRAVGITTVLVTHEQEEAFDLGDRVALLASGRIEQVGRPEELYRVPATAFVAGFVGRGTLLPAKIVDASGESWVAEIPEFGRLKLAAPSERATTGPCQVFVRPESVSLAGETDRTVPGLDAVASGTVESVRFAGPISYVAVRLGSGMLVEAMVTGSSVARSGERATLRLRPEGARLFPMEPGGRSR